MEVSFLTTILAPTMIEKIATSSNPFLYLVVILFGAIAWIAKNIYSDMKNDRKNALDVSVQREEKMTALSESYREESREREKALQTHLTETTEAFRDLTDVVNKSFEKLTDRVDEMSIMQEKTVETQKETFEAVKNLNETVKTLNTDMKDVKNRLENVEREHKR